MAKAIIRARAESLLFASQDEARKTDLLDQMKQKKNDRAYVEL